MPHLVVEWMGAIRGHVVSSATLGIISCGLIAAINVAYLPLCAYRLKKRGTSWYRRISFHFALLFLSVAGAITTNTLQLLAQSGTRARRMTPDTALDMYSNSDLADTLVHISLFYLFGSIVRERRDDLEVEVKEIRVVGEAERIMKPIRSKKGLFIALAPMLIYLVVLLLCASGIDWHESDIPARLSNTKYCLSNTSMIKYSCACGIFFFAVGGLQVLVSLRRLNGSVYRVWDRQAFPSILFVFTVGLFIRISLAEYQPFVSLKGEGEVLSPSASAILLRGAAQVWIVWIMLRKGYARMPLADLRAQEPSRGGDVEAQGVKAQATGEPGKRGHSKIQRSGQFKQGELQVIIEEDPALVSLEGEVSDEK